jgi:hypothetical protein
MEKEAHVEQAAQVEHEASKEGNDEEEEEGAGQGEASSKSTIG